VRFVLLRPSFSLVGWFAGCLVLALLAWPVLYSIWISFTPSSFLEGPTAEWSWRWYQRFLDSPQWLDALWNSLLTAAASTTIAVTLGFCHAYGKIFWPTRFAHHLTAVVRAPLLIPPVVIAMGLLPLMQRLGLWGSLGAISLAHALLALPVTAMVAENALSELDPNLPLAARGLGASHWDCLWTIVLPLSMPAIFAAALIASILSINEFIVALFLGTPETETLPKVIWPNLRYTLTPLVAAASTISLVITVLLLIGASRARGMRALMTDA
jgi:ABC-type spermidine/putrescine transport system permease subunit II